MPTGVYREAFLCELQLALRLARGRRWLGTLEGAPEPRLREWVGALGRGVPSGDRPALRMLPRTPQSWPEALSGRVPIALAGLESLDETRPGSFAESSPTMKGAGLLRALDSAASGRVLLLIPESRLTRAGGPLTDLLARAEVRVATDVTVPLPEGARLHPLPLQAPAVRPVEEHLRARAGSLRALTAAARNGPHAQSPESWSARVALGRLELLLGEVASAERLLTECSAQTTSPAARADALETLGDVGMVRGDPSAAAAFYQRAYHHAKRAADPARAEAALLRLGEVSALLGNYRDALRYYELARGPGSAPPAGAQRIERAIEAEQARLSRASDGGEPEELADALGELPPEAAHELGLAVERLGIAAGALGPPTTLESGPGSAEGAHLPSRTASHIVLLKALAQLAEEQGDLESALRHRDLAAQLEGGTSPSP